MTNKKHNWKELFSPLNNGREINRTSPQRSFDDLINSISDYPAIFYYASAGSDLRGLSYTCDYHLALQKEQFNRDFKKPELYVFTCLDSLSRFRDEIENREIVYSDSKTTIEVKSYYPLKINRKLYKYRISEYCIDFAEDPLLKSDSDAFICELEIMHLERQIPSQTMKLLYIEGENINFVDEILLKDYFKLLYLCTTREGLGFGCCKKSVISHLFGDSFSFNFGKNPPEYIISFTDYTLDILLSRAYERSIWLEDYGDYLYETGFDKNNPDSIVFKVDYGMQQINSAQKELRPELKRRMFKKKSFLEKLQRNLKMPIANHPNGADWAADDLITNQLPDLLTGMKWLTDIFDEKKPVDDALSLMLYLKQNLLSTWKKCEFTLRSIENMESETGLSFGTKMDSYDGIIRIYEELDENDEFWQGEED